VLAHLHAHAHLSKAQMPNPNTVLLEIVLRLSPKPNVYFFHRNKIAGISNPRFDASSGKMKGLGVDKK